MRHIDSSTYMLVKTHGHLIYDPVIFHCQLLSSVIKQLQCSAMFVRLFKLFL